MKNVLDKYFQNIYSEAGFMEKSYSELNKHGFAADNTIACVGVCRDEISQSMIEEANKRWGTDRMAIMYRLYRVIHGALSKCA